MIIVQTAAVRPRKPNDSGLAANRKFGGYKEETEKATRQVKINENLRDGIKVIADLNNQIGIQVHEMVINVQDDFEKTRENITKITNLRRSVREKQWELQKLNYKYHSDFQVFRYTESLIKYLMEAADRAEIFADRVFILIHKYAI